MLLPIGHENLQSRRWPIITLGLIVINFVAFLMTIGTMSREAPELSQTRVHIRLLAAMHPELNQPPIAQELVGDLPTKNPKFWNAAKDLNRRPIDAWDAQIRLIEDPERLQTEMDDLCARYDELRSHSMLDHYAYVPAHPTWYSYITANFLHGGWLHIIGNMWFLWLAGIVLEDAWGRGLYLLVYMLCGIFALQVQGWMSVGSNSPVLGASGAVAGLMGAFLVRFPTVKIRMAWLWWFRLFRFSVAAYWLLPLWLIIEILSGVLSGEGSGVAHWAHVGGFVLGMGAATGIRYSGLEHVISKAIDEEVDPGHNAEFDDIRDVALAENNPDEALPRLEEFLATHPTNEPALLLMQELQWRRANLPVYCAVTQKLCEVHLSTGEISHAIKDYEDLVSNSGGELLPAKLWFKLCQALETRQEFERALGEYQEISYAYPDDPQSLMALMAGARLALTKLNRPEQALLLYQAAGSSTIPHLDLEDSIQRGVRDANKAMSAGAGK